MQGMVRVMVRGKRGSASMAGVALVAAAALHQRAHRNQPRPPARSRLGCCSRRVFGCLVAR